MRPRVDTTALKRDHPVEAVAAAYGIALRRSGRALVGRCPLHDDAGRPNLALYPAVDASDGSWFCYRCGVGGDAIDLVARIERLRFLDAVDRLTGGRLPAAPTDCAPERGPPPPPATRRRTAVELACVAAAGDLYAARLRDAPAALAYLAGRGVDRVVAARHRLGWAAGGDLAAALRRRGLPLAAARSAGLLRSDGREHLAGRVVVPELRGGGATWLIGRTLPGDPRAPVYLGLPGPKPLLGWETVRGRSAVWVVEGPFDVRLVSPKPALSRGMGS